MSADKSICPHCKSPITFDAEFCAYCGARQNYYAPVYGSFPDSSGDNIKNPNQLAMIALTGPLALFFLVTLLALGFVLGGYNTPVLKVIMYVGGGLFAIFGLSWISLWVSGLWQMQKGRAFLDSDRPLLRWTYNPEEWREIKEAMWQDEKSDWQIQLGCLTVLFGLIGLLVGAMIGADEGLAEAITGGIGGAGLGVLIGGVIGAAVAGGNHLASRRAYYGRPQPGMVALAPQEIYANNAYFKGNGVSRYIYQIALEKETPPLLRIEMRVPPRPRAPTEEEWLIMVPPRLVEAVEQVIPYLTKTEPVEIKN